MAEYLIEPCDREAISAIDLRKELAQATGPVECYKLVELDAAGYRKSVTGSMLWFPEAGLAGIEWGADADWTNADSPQDAVRRYQHGQMMP